MTRSLIAPLGRLCTVGLLCTLFCGCSALQPMQTPPPSCYVLDRAGPESGSARPAPAGGPTLIVNPPQAAAGFDSPRIIYLREPHRLDYFAHSAWVDTPARMLAPLLVAALEKSGAFGAVLPAPTAAAGGLRLHSEIIRLQQDFTSQPSRVRFTLRAYVVDSATRRVLASRVFDQTHAAPTDDAYGGILAANRVVQRVLAELAESCSSLAVQAQPDSLVAP
ncbi:MAG: ABC-type transport auxiliary lipoprotein family protein [Candidatus Accumulibacter sp. UW26]|jgi:cholesterol transport system auxiliary component